MRFRGSLVWVIVAGSLATAAAGGCSGDDAPDFGFSGLSEEVEVIVDDRGIPHIYAANDVDLMYAAGYQMAVDRLFEMDLVRRRALGRRAEVLGERYAGEDALVRRVNIPRLARMDIDRLTREDPELRRMLEAWVAGVNAHIDEVLSGDAPLPYGFGPDELDYEPEPWTLEEAMAVPRLILFGNGSNLEFDILSTVLENLTDALDTIELPRPAHAYFTVPEEERPAAGNLPSTRPSRTGGTLQVDPELLQRLGRLFDLPGGFGTQGSNNWAVAGDHTDNGRPIICGDPHQPLDSPSLFYAHHLNSKDRGGTIDAAGFSFVGAPLIQIGRTDTVVWTATTNFADQMDIYVVPTDTGDATTFDAVQIAGEDVPVEARTEVIRVRQFDGSGAPMPVDAATEEEIVAHDVPGHGVLLDLTNDLGIPDFVVSQQPTAKLLLRWVGFDESTDALAWLGYNRAETVEDLESAVDEWGTLTSFNWVAADEDDIVYRVRMDIPDRDLSTQPMPTRALDGTDPDAQWTGAMLPPEQLPAARNPTRGYLATANNDPWGFTEDGDITNDPWYYGGFYAPGFRAARIEQELQRLIGEGPVTPQDMRALQLDVHSLLADEWVPLLEDAWAAVGSDEELMEFEGDADLETLATLLSEWDRRMSRDSPGALAFHLYAMFLTGEVLEDDITPSYYPLILNANGPFTLKIAALALREAYPNSDALLDGGPRLLALRALQSAADWLTDHYGGVDPAVTPYTWGEAHGTYFDMPWNDADRNDLVVGFVPTRGGEDTVNPSNSPFFTDDSGDAVSSRFDSGSGPIYRMVATFRENGRAEMQVNFPPGNVADPASPHFDDELEGWVEGEYGLFPFEREEVDAAAETTTTLPPGTGVP
ncbi:MAG: penicillin acylase family protein [Myxococcota bacterium]